MAILANAVTTETTNFDKMVQTLLRKTLEERLRGVLPHLMPGHYIPAKFVKGSNSTMRFLNIPDLETEIATHVAGTKPWLSEGTPPTPDVLSFGYEEFTAWQAGRTVQLTDVAIMENPFDLVAEAANVLARSAIVTADKYVALILSAGTNVIYIGGSLAGITGANIMTGAVVKEVVARMKSGLIPTFPDGTYHAIVAPGVTFELMSDVSVGGWVDAARYAGSDAILSGEIGKYAGVRFFESTNAVTRAASATVGSGAANLANAAIANGTGVVTLAAHGLVLNQKVWAISVTNSNIPVAAAYYVVAVPSSGTFTLSATRGGAAGAWTVGTDLVLKPVADVNRSLFLGPGAYAFGDWGQIESFVTAPGGHTDPLHQSVILGWKGFLGAMIVGEGASATNVSPPRYLAVESANSLR